MLKRLIFAVFVVGLFFTLNGTAISGDGVEPIEAQRITSDVPHTYGDIPDVLLQAQALYKEPDPAERVYVGDDYNLAPEERSGWLCDQLAPYGSFTWLIQVPNGGDSVYASRFVIPPGMVGCTLTVAKAVVYYEGYTVGNPTMRFYLWEDNGFGLPGPLLDSVDIAILPVATTSGAWWHTADFSAGSNSTGLWHLFDEGDSYLIGWKTVQDPGSGVDDIIATITDDSDGPFIGEERGVMMRDDTWGTILAMTGYEEVLWLKSYYCGWEIPPSDCYQKKEAKSIYWCYGMPHDYTGWTAYAQEFLATKRETLYTVEVGMAFFQQGAGRSDGSNNLIITIRDDDGTGKPGAIRATEIVPGDTYAEWPGLVEIDFYSYGIVFEPGDVYFVGFTTSGTWLGQENPGNTYEHLAGDDDTNPPGYAWIFDGNDFYGGGAVWYAYPPSNFHIYANVCTDAFDLCNYFAPGGPAGWIGMWPDMGNGIPEVGQAFVAAGDECAVRELKVYFYTLAAYPLLYTYNSNINVYGDGGGEPGALLGQFVLTPADYVAAGMPPAGSNGSFSVEITDLNIIVPAGMCYITVETLAPTMEEGIMLFHTYTDGNATYGGGTYQYMTGVGWYNNGYGWAEPAAFDIRAEICCIPFSERDCAANEPERAGEDWYTYQHDYARTGASYNSLGEHPECNLNVNWYYEHPTSPSMYTSPIIVDDKVVAAFDTEYKVLNLSDGTEVYSAITGDYFGSCRSAPTVTVIDIEGTPTEVIFIAGGTSETVACHDFSDGTEIWSRDHHQTQHFGSVRYCSFTVLDIGGTEVVYWGTDDGYLVAVEAATGNLFAGWTAGPNGNPVSVGLPIANKSGCTDGANLYYGSYSTSGGDIYKIDGATGDYHTLVLHGGGLQANTVFPDGPQVGEGFYCGISYENGVIYANSAIAAPVHPAEGVLYAINTADLSIKWAVASNRMYVGTPIVDMAKIYCGYWNYWVGGPIDGNAAAFVKETGALAWAYTPADEAPFWCAAVLTCEPDGYPDHLFFNGHGGFLACVNSGDGTEIFRRRFDYGPGSFDNRGGGLALSAYGDLVAQFHPGALACLSLDLTKANRPRLQIETYRPEMSVEFGSATNLHVESPPLFYNSGCADLIINAITVDLECDDNRVPEFSAMAVRPDVMDRASSIADKLTKGFKVKAQRMTEWTVDEFMEVRTERGERILNAGATVLPDILNDPPIILPIMPYTLGAGDDPITITFDVNQSLITRGPNYFCIEVETNDPDFYLNSGTEWGTPTSNNDFPSIEVTIAGGCLRQGVELLFGVDGDNNVNYVFNHGLIVDWNYTGSLIEINGDAGAIFGGTYLYAVSQHRLASASPSWGAAGFFISMQPDPNWCDNECAPNLTEHVDLGVAYSLDGETYEPVFANVVCKSYIDSLQDLSDGAGGWDWHDFTAPFDNDSTMGLYVRTRTVGATGIADLDNLTVEIMEVTERNAADVLGWKFGCLIDYDIGTDTAAIDRDVSTAWSYTAGGGGDVVWGVTKIPFGCGDATGQNYNFEPMKNVMALGASEALWHADNVFYDSAYHYMSQAPGGYGHQVSLDPDDQEFFCTITEHDFVEGAQTHTFAVALFAMHGVTDPMSSAEFAPLAKRANKWCGFGRGDVNNDGGINLADIVYLNNYVNIDPVTCPGPIPFMHLGDVDGTPGIDAADVAFLIDFYFNDGGCPIEDWTF